MQREPHPPRQHGAATNDVMAAIAAAMAAEEQAAATEAIQQRRYQVAGPQPGQTCWQAQAAPQAQPSPPPAPIHPQAFAAPLPAAQSPARAAPQPVAQAPAQASAGAHPFGTAAPPQPVPAAPSVQVPGETDAQVLSKEEIDAKPEEPHEIKNTMKPKPGMAIKLTLCGLPLVAAAGVFFWFTTDEQNQIAAQQFVEKLQKFGPLARETEGQDAGTGTNRTATKPTGTATKPAPPNPAPRTNNGPIDPIVIPVNNVPKR